MASEAFAGVGTKFQRWNGATWDDVAEVNAIEGPGMTKDTLEVTSLDTDAGYNEFITGFTEGGTLTLDMNFTRETYELMKEDFESDEVRSYRIQLPDYDSEPSTFTIEGLVIELPITMTADDKVTADVVIQITSQVILDIGSTVPEAEGEAPQRTSQVIQNVTPSRLDINYNQTLDSGSVPAISAFAVIVAGSARTVNSVAISGSQVRLTLASAVTYGQAVTVAYTAPGTNPIQNTSGVDAASYTAVTVTNNVAVPVESSSTEAMTLEELFTLLDDGNTINAWDHNLGVTLEDTDKAVLWLDQFDTAGMALEQLSSDGSRPVKVSNGIQFDGGDDCLQTGIFNTWVGASTFYVVAKINTFVSYARILDMNHASTLDLRLGAYDYRVSLYGSAGIGITDKYYDGTTFNIFKFVVNNGANSSIQANRSFKVIGDIGTTTPRYFTAGGRYAGSGMFNGIISAIIIRAGVEADGSTIDNAIQDYYNDHYVHFPISATVEDATPTKVALRWNEPIDTDTIGGPTDFFVTSHSIASVEALPDGYGVELTLNIAITQAETTLYAGTNEAASAGGLLTEEGVPIPFSRIPLTNNVVD